MNKKNGAPKPSNYFNFTPEELKEFKEKYPSTANSKLASLFGLSINQVWKLGSVQLKLRKYKKAKVKKEITTKQREDRARKMAARWKRIKHNPLTSSKPEMKKVKAPKWWVKKNKELIKQMKCN